MPHSGSALSHLIPALPGLVWALPYAGFLRHIRRSPDVRDFPPAGAVPVSLIIPARNESATIGHLLDTVPLVDQVGNGLAHLDTPLLQPHHGSAQLGASQVVNGRSVFRTMTGGHP